MTPIDKVRAALEYASRFVPALDSSGINEALRELEGKTIIPRNDRAVCGREQMTTAHDALRTMPNIYDNDHQFVGEFRVQSLKWLSDYYFTISEALKLLNKMENEMLYLCEKRTHLPEHDGATGYNYYVPVKLEDV